MTTNAQRCGAPFLTHLNNHPSTIKLKEAVCGIYSTPIIKSIMSADNHTEHLKTALFELFVARVRSYCFCWGDDPSSIRHLVEKHGFNDIFTGLDQYYTSTEELIQALEAVY